MENKFNIESLINEQKEIINKMEEKQRELDNINIYKENNDLKALNMKLEATLEDITQELNILKEENKQIKNALFSYSFSEKQYLIDKADKNLSNYFNDENDRNQLLAIEKDYKAKLQLLRNNIKNENMELFNKYNNDISNLENEISDSINSLMKDRSNTISKLAAKANNEFEKLKDEPLTDEQIKKATRERNIENLIGLNLINKIGILLIVIGVFTASRFAYLRLPELFKGLLIFAIGFIMLGGAEIVNRKKPSVVSLGIAAGGIAVLYLGLAVSFFALQILSIFVALLLTIGITLLALFLSIRYDSRTIASFALIGGYLPFLSILSNADLLIFSLGYFLALHLLVLSISFKKDWKITSYLGLILNIMSTSILSMNIIFEYYSSSSSNAINIIVIIYSFIAFGIYTVVPIISNIKNKSIFKLSDFVFFLINTFFSSIVIFQLFNISGFNDYYGALSIIFALTYYLSTLYLEKHLENEKYLHFLFRLATLVFVIFFIPLELEIEWFAMGWLAIALFLIVYGLLKEKNSFYKGGTIVLYISILSFILLDVLAGNLFRIDSNFTLKYTAMSLSGIAVLYLLLYKNTILNKKEKIFKYISVVNFWVFAMYLIKNEIEPRLYMINISAEYLTMALMIAITILIAFAIPRIKILRDKVIYIISIALYTIAILSSFILNNSNYIFSYYGDGRISILGTFIIIILTGICVFAIYDLMKFLVIMGKLKLVTIPIIVSGYFLLTLTQNLITHYNLAFSSILLSIIYIIMAALWIYFGFIKRISLMRHFGLGLSMLTVIKLFLVDLATLTQGYRIISYFTLGIVLVLISYLYQRFEKMIGIQDNTKIVDKDEDTPL